MAKLEEIRNLVSTEAWELLHQTDQDALAFGFAMGSLPRFCDAQIVAVQKEIAELNPYGMEAAQFMETAKNLRLIWRFWVDLKGFMEDMARMPDQSATKRNRS